MSPYVRTVKSKSGARAVQVVWSTRGGVRDIEHIGSAHDDGEEELLRQVAAERIVAGQGELDLGLAPVAAGAAPLPVLADRCEVLWRALEAAWEGTGLAEHAGEAVFKALVLARVIESTFKMAKSDLRARPVFSHTRQSIDAHITIVFAALAIGRWLEAKTGQSIKSIVRDLRRYRTITIAAGNQTVTAAKPIPPDIQDLIDAIHSPPTAH